MVYYGLYSLLQHLDLHPTAVADSTVQKLYLVNSTSCHTTAYCPECSTLRADILREFVL